MDAREKLVELIGRTPCCGFSSRLAAEHIADHLIANGVTVTVGEDINVRTNADRIRVMSDEELAIMFAMLRADLGRLDAAVRPYSGNDVNDNYDWLQQPAE